MTYLATVELTTPIRLALQAETLTFNRGQWVSMHGKKGRFISNKGGIITILWRYKGEPFTQYSLRYKRACLHRTKKFTRPAVSSANPPGNPLQLDAFLQELIDHPQWIDSETAEEMSVNPDAYEGAVICGASIEFFTGLMKTRTGVLIKSLVSGRRRIIQEQELGQYFVLGLDTCPKQQRMEGVTCH